MRGLTGSHISLSFRDSLFCVHSRSCSLAREGTDCCSSVGWWTCWSGWSAKWGTVTSRLHGAHQVPASSPPRSGAAGGHNAGAGAGVGGDAGGDVARRPNACSRTRTSHGASTGRSQLFLSPENLVK